jgi:hypothetical protein
MFNGLAVPAVAAANPVNFTCTAPDPNSLCATASVTVSYAPYLIKTNFGCSFAEYNTTPDSLVDRVTLPNGEFYRFEYERTPGFPSTVTGRVASITLPSGETIAYEYSAGGSGVNGITCADGSGASLTRISTKGAWKFERVRVTATESSTTITDPKGNQTFVQYLNQQATTAPFASRVASAAPAASSKRACRQCLIS